MCIMQLDTFLKSSFSIGTSKTAQAEGELHRMQGQSRGTYKPRLGNKHTASGAPASYRVITECLMQAPSAVGAPYEANLYPNPQYLCPAAVKQVSAVHWMVCKPLTSH